MIVLSQVVQFLAILQTPLLLFIATFTHTLAHPQPHQELRNGVSTPHVASTIRDILKSNEIIPQVLDDFDPSYSLDIIYKPSKKHAAGPVLLGNDLPVKVVSKRPVFSITHIASSSLHASEDNTWHAQNVGANNYTLILTDPDAISRSHPNKSEMCHWILTNVSSDGPIDLASLLEDQTEEDSGDEIFSILPADPDYDRTGKKDELESYYPPAPPPRTGPHRYVFVLLKGNGGKYGIKKPSERAHWGYGKDRHGVRDWAKENGLKVVGANFFFAQNKKQ